MVKSILQFRILVVPLMFYSASYVHCHQKNWQ